MKKRGKRRTKLFFFKNDFQNEATHVMEIKSEHVASLAQPPPLMCACSFSISLVGSDRNGKKEKTEKNVHQVVFFKNDFQNEATLVMENEKANTWQACYSRHR